MTFKNDLRARWMIRLNTASFLSTFIRERFANMLQWKSLTECQERGSTSVFQIERTSSKSSGIRQAVSILKKRHSQSWSFLHGILHKLAWLSRVHKEQRYALIFGHTAITKDKHGWREVEQLLAGKKKSAYAAENFREPS